MYYIIYYIYIYIYIIPWLERKNMIGFLYLLCCIIIKLLPSASVTKAPDPTRRRGADGLMYQLDPALVKLVDNSAATARRRSFNSCFYAARCGLDSTQRRGVGLDKIGLGRRGASTQRRRGSGKPWLSRASRSQRGFGLAVASRTKLSLSIAAIFASTSYTFVPNSV